VSLFASICPFVSSTEANTVPFSLSPIGYVGEAPCCKPEGREFDSHCGHRIFFLLTSSFQSHYGPRVNSASMQNENQECYCWQKVCPPLRLTNSSPSIGRSSRKCGSLDVSQLCRFPWPETGAALPFTSSVHSTVHTIMATICGLK
jgi:hypothetical protein